MSTIGESKARLQADMAAGQVTFQNLPEFGLQSVQAEKETLPESLVLVGIGGSSKGFEMLRNALAPFSTNVFVLDTFDPAWMREAISRVKAGAGILIISKSGGTLETIELADLLLAHTGSDSWVGVVTDAGSGLDRAAQKNSWKQYHIMPGVGGRFSVLSAVGLCPLGCLEVDSTSLLRGAQSLWEEEQSGKGEAQELAELMWQNILAGRHTMLLAYSNRLQGFLEWLTQLWWESLGQHTRDGASVGPLLLSGTGPHAQHSVGQLLRDGPSDKFVIALCLQKNDDPNDEPKDEDVSKTIAQLSEGHLAKHGPLGILRVQATSTLRALEEVNQQTHLLTIPRLDPYHLGRLIMTWQLVVSYLGYALNVNPFLQPGVERAKVLIRTALDELKSDAG